MKKIIRSILISLSLMIGITPALQAGVASSRIISNEIKENEINEESCDKKTSASSSKKEKKKLVIMHY